VPLRGFEPLTPSLRIIEILIDLGRRLTINDEFSAFSLPEAIANRP
jgi:hypothetical protein